MDNFVEKIWKFCVTKDSDISMRFYITFVFTLFAFFAAPIYAGNALDVTWRASSLSSGLEIKAATKKTAREADWDGQKVNQLRVPNTSAHLISFFDWLGHDVKKKDNLIDPVFVQRFPPDYDDIKNVQKRKSLFIRVVLPLILRENNRIEALRQRVIKLDQKKVLNNSERDWLFELKRKYKLSSEADIQDLLKRLDIVPAALALAQAINESGWGTSRFAMQGNALYGQWTWSSADAGIDPLKKEEGEKHRIKAFPDLSHSVRAYMLNLNRHSSYSLFRDIRHADRLANTQPGSYSLAQGLIKYSTKRQEYVDHIRELLVHNHLLGFDHYKLAPFIEGKSSF